MNKYRILQFEPERYKIQMLFGWGFWKNIGGLSEFPTVPRQFRSLEDAMNCLDQIKSKSIPRYPIVIREEQF